LRHYLTIGFCAALLAIFALPAIAPASVTITVEPVPGDDVYTPSSATLDLGDGSFDWLWGPNGDGAADVHNVLQNDALFASGEPVTSQPPFSVTASAGSYRYFCVVHLGMTGDVNVRPTLGASDTGKGPIALSWASASTTTGNKFDVRYSTGGKWKPWLKKSKKLAGKFGKRRKPAKVKKGRTYEFQARSRQGSDRSDWSPPLVVER